MPVSNCSGGRSRTPLGTAREDTFGEDSLGKGGAGLVGLGRRKTPWKGKSRTPYGREEPDSLTDGKEGFFVGERRRTIRGRGSTRRNRTGSEKQDSLRCPSVRYSIARIFLIFTP
jgi:hypothetical protein